MTALWSGRYWTRNFTRYPRDEWEALPVKLLGQRLITPEQYQWMRYVERNPSWSEPVVFPPESAFQSDTYGYKMRWAMWGYRVHEPKHRITVIGT